MWIATPGTPLVRAGARLDVQSGRAQHITTWVVGEE